MLASGCGVADGVPVGLAVGVPIGEGVAVGVVLPGSVGLTGGAAVGVGREITFLHNKCKEIQFRLSSHF